MARERSSGSNKGSLIQRPFTGGLWPKTMVRSMNSTGRQYPLVPKTIFHRGHEWNTIRDTTPPMYLTRTGIRSKSSIRASDGTSRRQGMVADIGDRWMTSKHGPLLEHAIPDVVVRKVQILIFASRPFAKEDVSGIFTAKVSAQSLFEGTPEEHRGTRGSSASLPVAPGQCRLVPSCILARRCCLRFSSSRLRSGCIL
jgi:hypothetical protein